MQSFSGGKAPPRAPSPVNSSRLRGLELDDCPQSLDSQGVTVAKAARPQKGGRRRRSIRNSRFGLGRPHKASGAFIRARAKPAPPAAPGQSSSRDRLIPTANIDCTESPVPCPLSSMDPFLVASPFLLTEHELLDLAGARLRQFCELDRGRTLEVRDLPAAEFYQLGLCWVGARL